MKKLDLTLCALLALGGLAHLGGTLAGYPMGTEVFVWSLSGTAFVFTIVFLHIVRILRPGDQLIAVGAIIATSVWVILAMAFGAAVGSLADPRALTHAVVSFGLVLMAARDLR